ncbi:CCA tRNA nucleotidyltransferase [Virgibacillus salexigens]|uniref:CCA tRNA nucleotidyltransferase n=1 Tax=Virgibacillus salexigens TaxID=61016 RepID=UPI00190E1874|nr:CCA tRNA nucleotidyltransferase [Virgibacillus salexigens]
MFSTSFNKAIKILETIENHQHQAYFVGGCVRDYLLQRPIGDIDIATSAKPEALQEMFHSIIPVGIEHGTVIVRYDKESYEVTTFRVDGTYTDQRHPDGVTYINNIDKDLERRDFTINALAMDINGNIIDLYNGQQDLTNGIIRTVGNGKERFKEDPLRIIRALRFSSQLGFMIDQVTIDHMVQVKKDIESLAIERITNEFTKFFASKYVGHGLHYLFETKIYKHLPVFKDHEQLIYKLPTTIEPLPSFGEVIAVFHLLDPSISVVNWVKSWKCSNKLKNEAQLIVHNIDRFKSKGLSRWLIYQLPTSLFTSFQRIIHLFYPEENITVEKMKRIKQLLPIQSRKELAINGNDIIRFYPDYSKGPWMKLLLNEIEKQVVTGGVPNNYQAIKEWIKWNPPEIN